MSDAEQVQHKLEEAEQAWTEHQALTKRRAEERGVLRAWDERIRELRAHLDSERADVEALESFSVTRILAGLKGSRHADLDRERAEAQAAEYAVASAEARRQRAADELARLEARLAELGDVARQRQVALSMKERLMMRTDPEVGRALDEVARTVGEREAELVQLREAGAAGETAHIRLQEARALLGKADSWSAYDTWFDGGMIASSIKHDRIDEAMACLRRANAALAHLSRELGDVRLPPIVGPQVSSGQRGFDIWFDNIFSDLAVRDQIKRALAECDGAARAVEGALATVRDRVQAAEGELRACQQRRESLLSG